MAVGGSPADKPISRWAIAKRVTESIRTSTSCPSSRKIFRDRERQQCRLAAHQGRFVGSRDDDHRTRQTLFAEIVLQEFLHLAAAFADQTDHRHIRRDVAREHRQQHRFADARARKNAEPLAAAAGQKCIDRPHAEIERLADPLARMRRRRQLRKV